MAEKAKNFFGHLEELRRRLIIILCSLFVITTVAYFFSDRLLRLIKGFCGIEFLYLSPLEPLMVKMKVALFCAILLSGPIILHQILSFIIPGLTNKEGKIILPVVIVSFLLFIIGAIFGFLVVLPYILKWLSAQAGGVPIKALRAEYLLSFIIWVVVICGAILQTPILVISLIKIKLLSVAQLRKQWQYVYLGIFIFSGIITPDWNPITMLAVAIPIITLWEMSLFLARFIR
ncbi:twin-arginine translocase subunit TatC [bacterium]|nr:twin-arginine translocase subunit TatC [bacterium]MBU1599240.1 twin-arginine translocase subunit TatC [bacterium]